MQGITVIIGVVGTGICKVGRASGKKGRASHEVGEALHEISMVIVAYGQAGIVFSYAYGNDYLKILSCSKNVSLFHQLINMKH